MLIPIIKDFNNTFSYLISGSGEKTKQIFDPVSKSLLHLLERQYHAFNDVLEIGWTGIRIIFLLVIQSIQYIVSFQWLRDFAYLPISIPNNIVGSNQNNSFIENVNNSIVSIAEDSQNMLQKFLFYGNEIANNINTESNPYNDVILGLPNVSHNGTTNFSWSLSFLSNKWFDPLAIPVNFLSTGLESSSKNTLSSLPEQITSDPRISNIILISLVICITTGFSSFVNGFFISLPLSLSNLLSLRYLMIQKFWAGCVSILGIVLGEITFMLFLIVPPPFIQITLVYLESIWPYIIGLSLIMFIIYDCINNPYNNSMSIYKPINRISVNDKVTQSSNIATVASSNWTRFLPIKLDNNTAKIFGFSFLLALTEQSCYFSFFGSLNLSSTANFLDTYLFAASKSPMVLFFSCIGFLIGSFLAIIIYNIVIAKIIFLIASLSIKIKQYNLNVITNLNRQTSFDNSINESKPEKNIFVQYIIRITYNIMYRLRDSFFYYKSNNFLKSLWLGFKKFVQLFISYLPGGKRIFLAKRWFPKQAHSYKHSLQTRSSNFSNKAETLISKNQNEPQLETRIANGFKRPLLKSEPSASVAIPKNSLLTASARLVDETRVFNKIFGNPLGGSSFYNKIDKIFLTCLISLSFTTIPYYSFDYLVNSFLGFTPQDQVLNTHSLRVNFPDYTNILGMTLPDDKSVLNTDVSLYDRAHFMYGEWPNSFESLNYQGEVMWTNVRDHRRQKSTRESARFKFKTLKTQISSSWKEFKRNSGVNVTPRESSLEDNYSNQSGVNKQNNRFSEHSPKNLENVKGSENSQFNKIASNSLQDTDKLKSDESAFQPVEGEDFNEHDTNATLKSLRNTNKDSNLFYKIFLASSLKSFNEDPSLVSKNFKNDDPPNVDNVIMQNQNNQSNDLKQDSSKTLEPKTSTKRRWPVGFQNKIIPKNKLKKRRSNLIIECIDTVSSFSLNDLSGGEKNIKTYPKNWKQIITEKYYQNPIYRSVLSNDLNNFLKQEPLTQQLTNNQENELYFLRVKMAHYYDSLRFYFNLKENINSTRSKANGADFGFFLPKNQNGFSEGTSSSASDFEFSFNNKVTNHKPKLRQSVDKITSEPVIISDLNNTQENTTAEAPESLQGPPFQFKSMASMNYRQQFKGTLKTVKELFAISLPESSGFSKSRSFAEKPPIEKSYKYDKYLFNEYPYPQDEFLHEESPELLDKENLDESDQNLSSTENTKIESRDPIEDPEIESRDSSEDPEIEFRNSIEDPEIESRDPIEDPEIEFIDSIQYPEIESTTQNLYNLFGSNDPFYVGWDQNLRKFVLTSRTLSRANALNYNVATNTVDANQKQLDLNDETFLRNSENLTNQPNNKNNEDELNTDDFDSIPLYSTEIMKKQNTPNVNQQSVHIYRPYTSWPFLKHELKNFSNRPYLVSSENYTNMVKQRIRSFNNININDVDTEALSVLYFFGFKDNTKYYAPQVPINIYKQAMGPSTLENLFTPISNARSSFLWPGSTIPAWEYYFW